MWTHEDEMRSRTALSDIERLRSAFVESEGKRPSLNERLRSAKLLKKQARTARKMSAMQGGA